MGGSGNFVEPTGAQLVEKVQYYLQFIDSIMCCPGTLNETCASASQDPCALPPLSQRRALPFPDMDAYRVLKIATECFLMMNCGVFIPPERLRALVTSATYDVSDDAGRMNQGANGLPDATSSGGAR